MTLGSVLFVPVNAPKSGLEFPAAGQIQPDGSYELTTDQPGDGAVVGEHKVMVIAIDGGAPAKSEGYNSDPNKKVAAPPKAKALVPEKYSSPDSTPLTRTVAAGDNTFDIEVVD